MQRFSHFPGIPPTARVRLTTLPEHDCSYLPGRVATFRGFAAAEIEPNAYARLLDSGFRRSGRIVYQPVCAACRQCRSIRVSVADFRPNRSQRRTVRSNVDVAVEVGAPTLSPEKLELYQAYVAEWHGQADSTTREDLYRFLYDSPTSTMEFTYRDSTGRLIGVGICDVSAAVLSSVYFFFDPNESRRSLGTLAALREIEFARNASIAHYHLGYWIADCAAMRYKANFRPAEVLGTDGNWHPLETA